MEDVVSRFLRYVKIDTTSQEEVDQVPSTPGQLGLGKLLAEELRQLGASGVRQDAHGYVYARIPANLPPERAKAVPAIGLIAHLDTSPSLSGKDVKPVVHRAYAGGDLVLPGAADKVLRAAENPRLADELGQDIITSDGTTLLGADDKAGVAEIMTLAARLLGPGAPPHGEVGLAFTPDEEVGRGADFFDVAGFGARYAYTSTASSRVRSTRRPSAPTPASPCSRARTCIPVSPRALWSTVSMRQVHL